MSLIRSPVFVMIAVETVGAVDTDIVGFAGIVDSVGIADSAGIVGSVDIADCVDIALCYSFRNPLDFADTVDTVLVDSALAVAVEERVAAEAVAGTLLGSSPLCGTLLAVFLYGRMTAVVVDIFVGGVPFVDTDFDTEFGIPVHVVAAANTSD